MRRALLIVSIGLLLFSSVNAAPMRISAGAFAGMNLPIAMDDVTSGAIYGFKARFTLLPKIGIEPNVVFSTYGDAEAEVYGEIQSRDGGKITSFGVDAVLGGIQGIAGLSIYGIVGFGSSKWSRDGIDDVSEIAYYLGLGVEYALPQSISIEVRAKAQIIPHEDGSYKNGIVTAGLNYYFGALGGM
ncbi:MAG: porin family protein [candidate division Zixibacteria bacterium]|nr:porin family protein [candidate division Zixibacteria bacterium]